MEASEKEGRINVEPDTKSMVTHGDMVRQATTVLGRSRDPLGHFSEILQLFHIPMIMCAPILQLQLLQGRLQLLPLLNVALNKVCSFHCCSPLKTTFHPKPLADVCLWRSQHVTRVNLDYFSSSLLLSKSQFMRIG